MPNIKPISDLRHYNELVKDIAVGEPVFLTKNGRGRYVLIDIADYEKTQTTLKLLAKLNQAEAAVDVDQGWIGSDEVRRLLGV